MNGERSGRAQGASSARPVTLGEFGALRTEGSQVSPEHRIEEAGVLNARRADYLAEFQAAQASGDNILRGHAGDGTEVQALALVELGGYHARANHLRPQPVRADLLMQGLGHRDEIGQGPGVHRAAPRAIIPGTAARASMAGAATLTCTSSLALSAGSSANGM